MERSAVVSLSLRYGILLALGLANLLLGENSLFYTIFTPLTINPVFHIFQLLYEDATLFSTHTIFIKGYYATIIPACVAGSAYYLLLILNLTTPMARPKRLWCLAYTFILFLVLNILRIVMFGALLTKGYPYFDITHLATWYFGSTVLVAGIWFSALYVLRIPGAPVFTDLQSIMKDVRRKS